MVLLITIPFWTNLLVRNYAWLIILRQDGWATAIARRFFGPDVELLYNDVAVAIGLAYSFLPFMILPLYAVFEKFDWRLLEAAYDLGADRRRAFFRVIVPMVKPGIVAGSMLVFILLMGDYILPQYLGGGKVFFIGNALVDLFLQSRNGPYGAAVSVAMVAIMFVTIFLYMRFVLGKSGQRRVALV